MDRAEEEPPKTKSQQLGELGGLRTDEQIQHDHSVSGSLVDEGHQYLSNRHTPFTPLGEDNDERLEKAALLSSLKGENLSAQAFLAPKAQAGQLMQQAHGLFNESTSYGRLKTDLDSMQQPHDAFPQSTVQTDGVGGFRQPDAVLVPKNGPGVIIREMKTRTIDGRSEQQLSELADQMEAPKAQMSLQGKPFSAPIAAMELEMRTSSKDISPETFGKLANVQKRTSKPVLMRTNSMTHFAPIHVVQKRQQVHKL